MRFNERSARMELQDAIEAPAGRPNWEPSDDLRGAMLREMIADTCLYLGTKGSVSETLPDQGRAEPPAVRPRTVGRRA